MNSKYIRAKIDSMAKTSGINGCAVIEVSAGMVWHAAGEIDNLTIVAEAASDYWRLYLRLKSNFDQFGELHRCVLDHANNQISLLPCGEDMVFLTLSDETHAVDWSSWYTRIQQLNNLLLSEY